MSWNKFFVLVSNQKNADIPQLLEKLKLTEYKKVGETDLYGTNKPKTLFISHFKDALLFSHPSIPYDFFKSHDEFQKYDAYPSEIENRFINCFPKSLIASIIEDGTGCSYGFSLIENGIKTRMKNGSDGEIYNDFGDPLIEEDESYENFYKLLNENGGEEQLVKEIGEEEFDLHVEYESSWGVPNLLSKRFLGEYINEINGELILFSKYKK